MNINSSDPLFEVLSGDDVQKRTVCAFPDCGRPHDAKGLCRGHGKQLAAGKTLRPIVTRPSSKSKIACERCGHGFFPRVEDHQGKCSKCRNRFATPLAQVREKTRMAPPGKRWCQECERYRAEKFFPYTAARCRPCLKRHTADRRAQKVYSLEAGGYAALQAAQGGVCAICQRATGAARSLAVDHDHDGECIARGDHPADKGCPICVRGLLCSPCNIMLGRLGHKTDALIRAINYLLDPPARRLLKVADGPDA